jgi:hypothetical protein
MASLEIIQKLFEKAEKLDWSRDHDCDNTYTFSKYSPDGQDFSFSVDTEGEPEFFLSNIKEYYNDYDASYEAYLWLDDSGHGKSGAPYEMIDVYNDMVACGDMVYDLWNELYTYYYQEFYTEEDNV